MTIGSRAGSRFPLAAGQETRIGRGLECNVILTDPLTSRVHAVIAHENDAWWLRDHESRNGTYVNGQKIDEAQLIDGCVLKVGSTVFTFNDPSHDRDPAHDAPTQESERSQTVVFDSPLDPNDTGEFTSESLQDAERVQNLRTLYQLSIDLLGCDDPDLAVRIALELLQKRVRASLAGFLWVSDDGQLKPKLVIPEDAAGKMKLSESLTELVCRKGHAVRIDNHSPAHNTASLRDIADAICVPLVHEKQTVGAIHVYLERGHFGPADFDLAKSLANILVRALVRTRRQATLAADHRRLVDKSAGFDELVGESKPMLDLKSKIARVARATGCVLIRGESGSGKELVARALHKSSPRADRPMLSVNCAAMPPELMESQLFGHKKGAFTGADSDHVGWFQQADTGTLFLDEVGEMTLEGQVKLLRIMEGHPFLPVGSTKEVSVDVRVIAATNRDLGEFVRDRRFREDLFYRLSVFELYIPPLRDRGGDIELLVNFFLDHFRRQHGRPNLQLSDAARLKLMGYQWPGNVRQLRNVIDSSVVLAEGSQIEPSDLGLRDAGSAGQGADQLETLRLDFWERKLITEALSRTGGSVPDAAKLLGIGRATLYRKIEEYGIER